jgi:hypothetical protein
MVRPTNLPWLLLACLLPAVAVAQAAPREEPKPAGISGVVSNRLTGAPLPHAHVRFTGSPSYGAMTTDDGRFSVTGMAPGRYEIFAERRGYIPFTAMDSETGFLELKAGETVNDLGLKLLPWAVISGRVLDSNGIPMENTYVQALSGNHLRFAGTNDRGEFRIGELHPGRYLIRAFSPSQEMPPEIRTDGTAELHHGRTYYPSSASPRSAAPVQARAGQETGGIEIRLLPSPILSVSGAVVNVPEGAMQDPAVEWINGREKRNLRLKRDKTFTAWRVAPGRYQLIATGVDGQSRHLRSAPVEITLTNTSIQGVRLELSPPRELSGQIQVEGGGALPAKRARPVLKFQPLGSLAGCAQDAEINGNGSFRSPGICPGRYYLRLEGLPENFYIRSARLGQTELRNNVMDLRSLPPDTSLDVQLGTIAAEISGVVRDAKGPVSGVQVEIFFDNEYEADLLAQTATDATGNYRLRGVAPGKYKLFAWDAKSMDIHSSSDGWSPDVMALYADVTERIDAAEGDKITRDLKLPAP